MRSNRRITYIYAPILAATVSVLLALSMPFADTISKPVTVAPKESYLDQTTSKPVAVAVPFGKGDRALSSKPVAVGVHVGTWNGLMSRPVAVSLPGKTGDNSFIARPAVVSFAGAKAADPGLVGLWHMEDTWGDSSGNYNHGIPLNAVSFSSESKQGKQSGSFNGTNSFLNVLNSSTLGLTTSMTLEAWIYPTDIANYRQIISKWGSTYAYELCLAPSGNLGVFVSGNGSAYEYLATTNSPIPATTWTHVAATFDNGTLRIYVNGREAAPAKTTSFASLKVSTIPLNIGRSPAGSEYFSGLIDEAAVYSRALTPEEIAAHAAGLNDPNAPAPPSLDQVPDFVGTPQILLSGSRAVNTAVWVNGRKIAAAEPVTSWSGMYDSLLPGVNLLDISLLDTESRRSLPVTARVFYDNVPPIVSGSIPANGSDTAKTVTSVKLDLYDRDAGIDLAGSMQGATVVNEAGQQVAGSWSTLLPNSILFQPSTPLAAGTFTVSVQPVDIVGNRAAPQQITFSTFDRTAPATTATVSGTKGADGWYSSAAAVALSAADGDSGSGIDRIEYSLDGSTWKTYSAPVLLDRDGTWNLLFRAVDRYGVVESPKSATVRVNRSGLVGLWRMDGDWDDASVAGNHGIPRNGVTFSGAAKIGENSGSFDGSNDYVEIANSATLNPPYITIETWAKSATSTWSNHGFFVSKRDAYILHPVSGSREIRFYIYCAGEWRSVSYNDPALDITQWHHYAGVFDGRNLSIFVDGKKSNVAFNGVITNADTGSLFIGWDDGQSGKYFNGLLDEVAIHNRPLSDREIQEHYRNYSIEVPTVEPVVSPTNIPVVTLRGTKPANTSVVASGTTIAPLDASTTWEATYPLASGMNNLSVTAMDADGFHSQAAVLPIALDDKAPTVTATNPIDGGIFNNDITSLSFTLSDEFSPVDVTATLAGAIVRSSSGLDVAGEWTTAGAGSTLTFLFNPAMVMSEGSYAAILTPTDIFGNAGVASLSFAVDMTPPPAPEINQLAVTNYTTRLVTGTKSPDTTKIFVSCAGASAGSVSYPTADTWNVTVSNLREGTNAVFAYAEDAAGNQSADASMNFTVDTSPPAKPVIDPPVSPTRFTSVTIVGLKDRDTNLFVNSALTDAPFAGNAWSRTVQLSEGSNGLTVFAKDAAGNQSQSATVTIVRDTAAPTLATSTPSDNSFANGGGTITVTFADSAAGADLAASIVGAVVKNGSGSVVEGTWSVSGTAILFTPSAPLPDGSYTVTVYPVDILGNRGSASFSFTLDRAPPTVQGISMSPASPHKAEMVSFTMTFSDQMDTAQQPVVTMVRPGMILDTTYAITGSWSGSTTWTGSFPFTASTGDGTYELRVSGARDKAQNTLSPYEQKGAFVLDTTSPAAPTVNAVTSPTKAATQIIGGGKPADTAVIINGTQRIPRNADAVWSYSYPLSEGTNTISVVARDEAGNDSAAASPAPVIVLDTTPPLFAVDSYKTPVSTPTQSISGRKEPGCVVKMNGATILDAGDHSATWSYLLDLTESNGFTRRLDFTATDAIGNTTAKSISVLYDSAPPPALPAGMLVASGEGKGTEVSLSWPSYSEGAVPDLAYYRVYLGASTFGSVEGMTPLSTVNKGTRSYVASGLSQGTTYFFAVVPVDASGNYIPAVNAASASPSDTAPPEDVSGLSASSGHSAADGNYVNLSWTGSRNSRGDLAAQALYVDDGTGYDAGTVLPASATTWKVSGLSDAKLYRLKLTVKDSVGHESTGVTVTAVTRLANPSGVTAIPGNSKITLSWSPVSSPYVKFYNVYRLKSAVPQTDVAGMTLAKAQTGTSFTDTGLENGAVYQYAVTTLNTSGAERTDAAAIAASPRGDTTGPVIGTISVAANQVITAPVTLSATATDSESAVSRMEILIDGNTVAGVSGPSVSHSWYVLDATDGNHTIRIIATDAPGNVSETTVPVVVSLAPPPAPIITTSFSAPITQTAVTISGTTHPGSTVTLRVNGVVASSVSTAASAFTIPSVTLKEGDNLVSAKAANRGGESAWSADLRIVVDTGAPAAPTALAAKLIAGGSIQFSWQAASGETPTGYNLYEGSEPFTSTTSSGVKKVNTTSIPYPLKEYIPAADAPRSYAVTALDGAANESALSNVVTAASDRLAPSVREVLFTSDLEPRTSDPTFGPETVRVSLTVTEPLKELPFFSLEPISGSPIIVSLRKIGPSPPVGEGMGEGEIYEGSFVLDAGSPQGATTWKFSGKDMIGNRGNGSGQGIVIDTRGPVADITAPVKLLKSNGGAAAVSFSLDEPSVVPPSLDVRGVDGAIVHVTALSSANGRVWSGTLDPSTLKDGNAQFVLSGARDRFGNVGSTVKSGGTILVYANAPPAPAVPEGLSARSGKGGEITVTWSRFGDADTYRIYRRGEGETAPVAVGEVTGTVTTWAETPPADGTWSYSVSGIGLLESESERSAEIAGLSDRTAPPVPTALELTLTGNGVQATWLEGTGETANAFRLYRSDSPITDSTGLSPVITIKQSPAVDTGPTSARRFYAVTSLDALGNESTPSAGGEIIFPVAPVRNLVLTLVDDGKPSLVWEAGEGNLQGFHIYRNGARITETPTTSTSYSDGYYSGGSVKYAISAVSTLGTESPLREVTLPALTVGLKEGTTLRRGMLENVAIVVSVPAKSSVSSAPVGGTTLQIPSPPVGEGSSQIPSPPVGEGQGEGELTIDSVSLKIGSLPESTLTGPFTTTAAQQAEIVKVAATDSMAPPQVAVVTTAVLAPSPGTTVRISRSSLASVIGSGTALEIFNDPLIRGTTGKVRIKVNNLGSAQLSFLTSENGGATGQVKVRLLDQDGNLLAEGRLDQRTGAVVNSGSYTTARIEPGQSFLSDPITIAVPSTAPFRVVIEAEIVGTYYRYGQPDQVSAPGLKQSVQGTIADVSYMASATIDKNIYRQGESVRITGSALSTATGEPMSSVAVRLGVSVNGFDRFFTVNTDAEGKFAYTFAPGNSETGTYTVWATHPDLGDRSMQAQFSIIGLWVSPTSVNVTTTRTTPVDVPVAIRNLSMAALSGLNLTTGYSSGISATVLNGGGDILAGGEARTVTFRLSPQEGAPDSGYASLNIATAEGLSGKVEADIRLVSPLPVISTSPSYIDTGIARGNQRIASFTVTNTGMETLKNARLEGPSLPWLSLAVDRNIGDIGVGKSKSVGILINPGDTVAQGVYDDRIVIYADNHIPYTYNIEVTVTSNAVGSVQFSIIDELMKQVGGASITIQNQSVLELIYILSTAADGSASLTDIPEGRYSFNIAASGHSSYGGSFVITPGVWTTMSIALEVNLVQVEWSITPITIEDQYEVKVTQTFETNVPTAVLVMDPPSITLPDLLPGEVYNGEITVTNTGLIEAYDIHVNFPNIFEDYDIEILTSVIPQKLGAMQKVAIPYKITRRLNSAESKITNICTEVYGYGGIGCFRVITGIVTGRCVICPSTVYERIRDVISAINILFRAPCPASSETSLSTSGVPVASPVFFNYATSTQSSGQTLTSVVTTTMPVASSCDQCLSNTWKNYPEVGINLPNDYRDALNRTINRMPGGMSIEITKASASLKISKRDCCYNGSVVDEGEVKVSGKLKAGVAGNNILAWGWPEWKWEKRIGFAGTIGFRASLGLFYGIENELSGELTKYNNACTFKKCETGKMGLSISAKADLKAKGMYCYNMTDSQNIDESCNGVNFIPVSVGIGISGEVSKDQCNTPMAIHAYLGKTTVTSMIEIDIFGVRIPAKQEWLVCEGKPII